VFSGLPQSEYLLTICCLVVLVSVLVHGLSPSLLIKAPRDAAPPHDASVNPAFEQDQPQTVEADNGLHQYCSLNGDECSWADAAARELSDPEYISLAEVKKLQADPGRVVIIDARTERTYNDSDQEIPGAVRVPPDQSVRAATQLGILKKAVLAVLCA